MPRELPPTSGLGPRVLDLVGGRAQLEPDLAAFLGVDAALLTCSATAGLVIAFEHLKTLSPARTAILPGYTCPLVAMAAREAGLAVRLCDLAPGTFDLDPRHLERLLDRDALCVIVTHWGGALANVEAVREVVRRTAKNTFIVEDAAQAFGARVGRRSVGLSGDVGVFSFAAGKGFTLYEGGALVSSSPGMMAGLREVAARLLRPDLLWEARRSAELLAYTLLYRPWGLYFAHGIPTRYWMARGDMAKALGDTAKGIPLHRVGRWRRSVGSRSLQRLPRHLAATRDRFARIGRTLGALPGLQVHPSRDGESPTGTYVIVTLASAARAEQVLRQGATLGLGVSRLFAFTLDRYPELSGLVGESALPVAADMAARSVTVGTSGYVSRADEHKIAALFASHG
jgi:perosamine synthetase